MRKIVLKYLVAKTPHTAYLLLDPMTGLHPWRTDKENATRFKTIADALDFAGQCVETLDIAILHTEEVPLVPAELEEIYKERRKLCRGCHSMTAVANAAQYIRIYYYRSLEMTMVEALKEWRNRRAKINNTFPKPLPNDLYDPAKAIDDRVAELEAENAKLRASLNAHKAAIWKERYGARIPLFTPSHYSGDVFEKVYNRSHNPVRAMFDSIDLKAKLADAEARVKIANDRLTSKTLEAEKQERMLKTQYDWAITEAQSLAKENTRLRGNLNVALEKVEYWTKCNSLNFEKLGNTERELVKALAWTQGFEKSQDELLAMLNLERCFHNNAKEGLVILEKRCQAASSTIESFKTQLTILEVKAKKFQEAWSDTTDLLNRERDCHKDTKKTLATTIAELEAIRKKVPIAFLNRIVEPDEKAVCVWVTTRNAVQITSRDLKAASLHTADVKNILAHAFSLI